MKSKEELDALIRELSAKKESYHSTEENASTKAMNLDFPELEPVDFDLSKPLHHEEITSKIIEPTNIENNKPNILNLMLEKVKSIPLFTFLKNIIKKAAQYFRHTPSMLIILMIGLVATVGFGVFSAGCSIFNDDKSAVAKALSTLNKKENTDLLGADRVNILLLGIDSPDGKFDTRSDTMILLSLDPQTRKISALSIPRDTLVTIPGHGKNKINEANQLGGPELTLTTVEQLLGVQIDHYAITNFNGFEKLIDAVGGVDLDVEKNMHYRTYNGMIDLKKGYQHLDGNKALQYVRFRHDSLGDISRTQRQQKFMTALANKIMNPEIILRLPKILSEVSGLVKTDLSISEMLSLATTIKNFDLKHLNTQTLPGNFINYKGISYWYVDEAMAKKVILDVFVGKNEEVVNPNLRPGFADEPVKKAQKIIQQPSQKQQPEKNQETIKNPDSANTTNTTTKDNAYPKVDTNGQQIPVQPDVPSQVYNDVYNNSLSEQLPENNISQQKTTVEENQSQENTSNNEVTTTQQVY